VIRRKGVARKAIGPRAPLRRPRAAGTLQFEDLAMPCRRESARHIRMQLRCYEPRGGISCGSPMATASGAG
jgi:hypothetical protein